MWWLMTSALSLSLMTITSADEIASASSESSERPSASSSAAACAVSSSRPAPVGTGERALAGLNSVSPPLSATNTPVAAGCASFPARVEPAEVPSDEETAAGEGNDADDDDGADADDDDDADDDEGDDAADDDDDDDDGGGGDGGGLPDILDISMVVVVALYSSASFQASIIRTKLTVDIEDSRQSSSTTLKLSKLSCSITLSN